MLVLAVAFLAAACGSSGGSDGSKAGTSKPQIGEPATVEKTSSTDTAETTATTAAPATPAAPTGSPSPREAAQRLYDTWKAGDRPSALLVATPDAVDGMFATAPGDYSLYNDCDSGEFDTSGCLFRGNSGTIQFNMERKGAAWVVVEALFSAP